MKGNYHKATDKYIDLLLEVIDKLFESIEELEALVNKLLNEGELVMN
jgi:tetrahydromethanopterin S-methyltransferase subunit B